MNYETRYPWIERVKEFLQRLMQIVKEYFEIA